MRAEYAEALSQIGPWRDGAGARTHFASGGAEANDDMVKIARLAIGESAATQQKVFDVPPDTAQNYHIEGLPFGTRGGILIPYQFPTDDEYSFNAKGVTSNFQAVLGQITC